MGLKTTNNTLISKETLITGDLEFSDALHIEGVIKGNVRVKAKSQGTIHVAEGGKVIGDIVGPNVVVNGSVEGNIYATAHIELASKARVTGDVHYSFIEMVKGAQLSGQMIYTKEVKEPSSAKVISLEKEAE